MYGGDEVNAVVIDVGSCVVKAGYAGEDTPKAVFPSHVGYVDAPGDEPMDGSNGSADGGTTKRKREDLLVGLSAINHRRDNMEIVPSMKDGLYEDMEYISALWNHAFSDRLRLDPSEHPMLLAEPTMTPKALREAAVTLMFEKFGAPALFLAKNAVLSSFAVGRQTSLSVDLGHQGAVVAAVHDGYVLQKSIGWSPLGGQLLTRCMLQSVEAKGSKVRPRYEFVRKEFVPGQFEVQEASHPGTRPSFRAYHAEQIAADLKETVCRVSDSTFVEAENENIPTVTYELPDGTEIQVGPDRFKVPEVLFHPELASTFPGIDAVKGPGDAPALSVHGLVLDSINRCDVDVRRDLYQGVVLTGGTSLFTQLRDRLEKELGEQAPQVAKVKVFAPANAVERRFSVWIGGSILASLGSFQQMWMSKAEYDEHGPALIHRKSP